MASGITGYGLCQAELAGLSHTASDVALNGTRTQRVASDSCVGIHEGHVLRQTYDGKLGGGVRQTAAAGAETA